MQAIKKDSFLVYLLEVYNVYIFIHVYMYMRFCPSCLALRKLVQSVLITLVIHAYKEMYYGFVLIAIVGTCIQLGTYVIQSLMVCFTV